MAEYLRPQNLAEACEMRASKSDYVVIAGCTDALVERAKHALAPGLIDVFGLGDIRGIQESPEEIIIGAATTYAEVLASQVITDYLPMLQVASRQIGAMQIQERGTLGGNLVTSSPVGDTLPVWLASEATIEVASSRGKRLIPYIKFITGYRQTDLASDELVVSIRVSKDSKKWIQYFRKVGTRAAQSISKVMLAAVAEFDAGRIKMIRLSLGAVADRTIRVSDAETLALNQVPSKELAASIHRAVFESISPIDDLRSNASYRNEVAARLCASFVSSLIGAI